MIHGCFSKNPIVMLAFGGVFFVDSFLCQDELLGLKKSSLLNSTNIDLVFCGGCFKMIIIFLHVK